MKKLADLIGLEKASSVEIRYCEIIADKEDGERRCRILKNGERYFYHEMRNGEVFRCFEMAESWRPFAGKFIVFAYTPDDRHVYEIESRNPTLYPSIHKLDRPMIGDSAVFQGHTLELADGAIIMDGKKIPVEQDHTYAWKLMKTKIRAIGGAEELFSEMELMAEEAKNGIFPLFEQLWKIIAEKYVPQAA